MSLRFRLHHTKGVRLRTFSTFNFSPKYASFPTFFVILMAEDGATFFKS